MVIPITFIVLPIPYALPPSITMMSLIVPAALTVTFAVACFPVVDAPIETSLAL